MPFGTRFGVECSPVSAMGKATLRWSPAASFGSTVGAPWPVPDAFDRLAARFGPTCNARRTNGQEVVCRHLKVLDEIEAVQASPEAIALRRSRLATEPGAASHVFRKLGFRRCCPQSFHGAPAGITEDHLRPDASECQRTARECHQGYRRPQLPPAILRTRLFRETDPSLLPLTASFTRRTGLEQSCCTPSSMSRGWQTTQQNRFASSSFDECFVVS